MPITFLTSVDDLGADAPIGTIWSSSSWMHRVSTGWRGVAPHTSGPRPKGLNRPLLTTYTAGGDHLERRARPIAGRVLQVWTGDHGIPAGLPRPHRYEAPRGFAVFPT